MSELVCSSIRAPDGLRLSGTLVLPGSVRQVAVLVHGGGVTREEDGFFTRLAAGLADVSVASLHCDLRGHGESEGRQEDLTIAGTLGDLHAAIAFARSQTGTERTALLGTSFSGGICGYYATQHPTELASLVMLNPLLNHKKRFIDAGPSTPTHRRRHCSRSWRRCGHSLTGHDTGRSRTCCASSTRRCGMDEHSGGIGHHITREPVERRMRGNGPGEIPEPRPGPYIIGKGGKSQIATLVDRTSRYAMLVRIPYDRTAERVAALLARKMETLPDFLRKSITWDQGKEMAAHANFTIKTGIDVYFCDPHSPWQRGSNENTNGLLRQYFPKGTDLSVYTQAEFDAVADELNNRPRQTLGWLKLTEVFNKFPVEAGGAPTT